MSPEAESVMPKRRWSLADKTDFIVALGLWTFASIWGGATLAEYARPIPEPAKVVQHRDYVSCEPQARREYAWMCATRERMAKVKPKEAKR